MDNYFHSFCLRLLSRFWSIPDILGNTLKFQFSSMPLNEPNVELELGLPSEWTVI
jgi:hypothetical protein